MSEAELEALKVETLRDTLEQIDGYFAYSARLVERGRDAFFDESDPTLRMAAYGLIVQLGEAAKFLPDSYRAEHTAVRWKAIIDMRSRVAHQYNDVDWELIWSTLEIFHPVDGRHHRRRE